MVNQEFSCEVDLGGTGVVVSADDAEVGQGQAAAVVEQGHDSAKLVCHFLVGGKALGRRAGGGGHLQGIYVESDRSGGGGRAQVWQDEGVVERVRELSAFERDEGVDHVGRARSC